MNNIRKSDDEDNYADWMMVFEENASKQNGFNEDEDLDRDLMDELYDDNLLVDDALREYLERKSD
ncbi:MAG: hypothetical protein IM631_19215 [Cytophagales bacterium]|nr:hypothetical protein [Cytophagales bacterium]MCA6373504.1 hypothetical protein [Cytophagales bacterium]MCA6385355.1 hypothetical protein [Cytophagales bacterium]